VLSHVLGAVDKTSSSFSAHGKIGNFIISSSSSYVFYSLLDAAETLTLNVI